MYINARGWYLHNIMLCTPIFILIVRGLPKIFFAVNGQATTYISLMLSVKGSKQILAIISAIIRSIQCSYKNFW